MPRLEAILSARLLNITDRVQVSRLFRTIGSASACAFANLVDAGLGDVLAIEWQVLRMFISSTKSGRTSCM